MLRLLAGVLTAVVFSVPGVAEETTLQRLDTADATRGWEAVGRLNLGRAGYCTGALVAPDVVLTAAHCLYDKTTGTRIASSQIEFLAGWRNGRAAAYRSVTAVAAHPDFDFSVGDNAVRVAHDLALLRLDRPIRNGRLVPYQVDVRPRKGASVGVVSYARKRSEAPSLQESCRVLARQGRVMVMSCDVDHGSSGAPVFSRPEGDEAPRIVSIISAKADVRGRQVALGVSLDGAFEDVMAVLNAGGDPEPRSDPVSQSGLVAQGELRPSGGSTLVRSAGTTPTPETARGPRVFGSGGSAGKFLRPEG